MAPFLKGYDFYFVREKDYSCKVQMCTKQVVSFNFRYIAYNVSKK